MKRTLAIPLAFLVVAALALPTVLARQGDQAEVQLKAAINKEVVEGNLKAAIDLYRKIAQSGNRPVAARALVRMGQCYEKLGDANAREARKAYEQVVREFGDQAEMAAEARTRLAALKAVPREASSLATLRLVWEGPEVELMGAPSPDGRYICYTDWDTGDLAIHDLTTGQNRRLSGQKAWDGSFAENSRWSPDGRLIAFTWATVGDTADLRIVGLDGAKPRILFQDKKYSWATVEDWSPDGKQILARLYLHNSLGRASVLSLVSTSDGSVRQLKDMSRPATTYASYMKFSPDGKYIASDYQNVSASSLDKDIVLLSLDGKTETPLVKHPADDYLLGWTPDGNSIVFASDRTGAIDAWIQPVAGGRPAGEPRMVRKDIGAISPLGFTRDGAFFYGHGTGLRNIYVATIERTEQGMRATYRKLDLPFEGRNDTAEFSPDGKRLAFVRASNRKADSSGGIRTNSLCVFSLDTGEEKTFPLNLRTASLRWSPDGSSILVNGFDEMATHVRRVDAGTGTTKEVFPTPKDFREEVYLSPEWSPDGRTVYCVVGRRTGATFVCSIVAKDLQTDQTRVVRKESAGFPLISVSPDGTSLAAYELTLGDTKGGARRGVVKVISTKDGAERQLCEFLNATNPMVMPRWSRDGRDVLFVGRRPDEQTSDVWYVPVEGGTPAKLGLSVHGLGEISPHPDGVRIAFSSLGSTVRGPQVWVMENFLPAGKVAR
jgi:Tol biopolymer transport system component